MLTSIEISTSILEEGFSYFRQSIMFNYLTLMMTSAWVVTKCCQRSVTPTNNSPPKDSPHPQDETT